MRPKMSSCYLLQMLLVDRIDSTLLYMIGGGILFSPKQTPKNRPNNIALLQYIQFLFYCLIQKFTELEILNIELIFIHIFVHLKQSLKLHFLFLFRKKNHFLKQQPFILLNRLAIVLLILKKKLIKLSISTNLISYPDKNTILILRMSSRIKKTFFFSTKQACLFYYCDLPLGYRILKSVNATQNMGQLVCILVETGQVFTSKLTSRPNLNQFEEWNEFYFKKLFLGMQNFILQEVQNQQDEEIEFQNSSKSQSQSQAQNKKASNSKILLVRDLTSTEEQIYLLRCILNQTQFHNGRVGLHRLWQEFEKYNKFMRKEEITHEKLIQQLNKTKNQKFKQINQQITLEEKKKNNLREKLTLIWSEKTKKVAELSKGREHILSSFIEHQGKDDDQSSMIVSDVSNGDILNSQDDRPLTGSLFEPSLSYYCREGVSNEIERQK